MPPFNFKNAIYTRPMLLYLKNPNLPIDVNMLSQLISGNEA